MKRLWKWLQSGLGSLMVDGCWQDIACDYHEHTLIGARKEAHHRNGGDISTYVLRKHLMSKNFCHFNKNLPLGYLPEDVQKALVLSWESVTHLRILIHLGKEGIVPSCSVFAHSPFPVQQIFSDKTVVVNMLHIKHLLLLMFHSLLMGFILRGSHPPLWIFS